MSDWGEDEAPVVEASASSVDVAPDDEAGDVDEPAEEGGDVEETEPTLCYGSVDEFLREYLRNVYRRKIDGQHRTWGARFWEYDEALIRIEALWRAWEQLRLDAGTGMSTWWRDHADHHMAVLMDPDNGPFSVVPDEPENKCKKGEPLPYVAPPAGMFPDVRLSVDVD